MLVFVPHLLIPPCDQNSTQLPIHALTRYFTSAVSTLFIQYLLLLQHFVGFCLPRVWFHAPGFCLPRNIMLLGSRKFWFSSKFFSLNLLCPSLKSCNTIVNVSIYVSIYFILSCITLSLTSFVISHNMTTSFTTGLAPWASLPPVFMFVGLSLNTKLPSAACSGRNSFLFHPRKWCQNVYVKIWSSCVATKHPRQHLNLF